MPSVIEKKIVGYRVKTEESPAVAGDSSSISSERITLTEQFDRPEVLVGKTYKIKPANSDAAYYITINDAVLPSTHGVTRHPFEMFISTKDVDHSFRKGGEVAFIAEELKAIHDPKGGYFVKGKGYVPSLVAHIGLVLEEHLAGDTCEDTIGDTSA